MIELTTLCYIEDGDYYLMLHRIYKKNDINKDKYIGVGGHLEKDESPDECLVREIFEETGLEVTYIQGEEESVIVEHNGYKVLNYTPFSCSQNVEGDYPIMVQVFICRASGKEIDESNESRNLRWVSLNDLREMLRDEESFYPMHVSTLKKYLKSKEQ